MIVSLRGGELKVEAMTDEFVSLKKTTDVMAKLSAVVQKGNMDASYNVVDDDVNKKEKQVEEKGTTCRELNATTGSNSKAAAVKTVVRITKERRNDGKEPLAKKRTLQTRKRKSKWQGWVCIHLSSLHFTIDDQKVKSWKIAEDIVSKNY